MFQLMHDRALAVPFPGAFADHGIAHEIAAPFGAVDKIEPSPVATRLMARAGVEFSAVGVGVDGVKMIVHMAVMRLGAGDAATAGDAVHGIFIAHRPGHFVQFVHKHLHDKIAGEPCVIIPVAHLVFHVAPAGLALGELGHAPAVPGGFQGLQVADLAVMQTLHHLLHAGFITPTETADHEGALRLGPGGTGEHTAHPGRIHGHRFFGKDMFLGGYGGL